MKDFFINVNLSDDEGNSIVTIHTCVPNSKANPANELVDWRALLVDTLCEQMRSSLYQLLNAHEEYTNPENPYHVLWHTPPIKESK